MPESLSALSGLFPWGRPGTGVDFTKLDLKGKILTKSNSATSAALLISFASTYPIASSKKFTMYCV